MQTGKNVLKQNARIQEGLIEYQSRETEIC